MLKKFIAIDTAYADRLARSYELPYFPVREFRHEISKTPGTDVIEMLVTVPKRVPDDDSPESIASVETQVQNKVYALEMNGAKVLVCPSKRLHSGEFKQSDDQRLTISTLSSCLKLKPDFLVFVAADSDYAPMLWELRNEGVRSIVYADERTMANDLKRVAYHVVDLAPFLAEYKRRNPQFHYIPQGSQNSSQD